MKRLAYQERIFPLSSQSGGGYCRMREEQGENGCALSQSTIRGLGRKG
jgi:hypothetical protein